jgi:two-component system response regulator LytT
MNAIIIEDEPRAAKRLESIIYQVDSAITIVATLESITEAIRYLKKNINIDIIFSDIELADGVSFEIFSSISPLPPIIFTTAYDQYAIKAFKNNGIDYLLKPVKEADVLSALTKLKSLTQAKIDSSILQILAQQLKGSTKTFKDRFLIKVGTHIKSILTSDIHALYSLNKDTYIFTKDKRNYVLDHSLDYLEETLNPAQFYRINRHFIISIHAPVDILAWSNSRLKIDLPGYTGDLIVVSRNKTKAYKLWLGDSTSY